MAKHAPLQGSEAFTKTCYVTTSKGLCALVRGNLETPCALYVFSSVNNLQN